MNINYLSWKVLAPIAFIALLLATLVLPPVPRPKARPMRCSAVNNVPNIPVTLPSTSVPPAATTHQ